MSVALLIGAGLGASIVVAFAGCVTVANVVNRVTWAVTLAVTAYCLGYLMGATRL